MDVSPWGEWSMMNRIEALNILGLDADADADDIKVAYRECAQILHPDRFSNNAKLQNRATEQFKRLQEAYDFLTSGRGSKGPGQGGSGSSRSRSYQSSMSYYDAQLAGLAAARVQLVAQRDELLDKRRTALFTILVGGAIALLTLRVMSPIVKIAESIAAASAIGAAVQFGNIHKTLQIIDGHLADIDRQKKEIERQAQEEEEEDE